MASEADILYNSGTNTQLFGQMTGPIADMTGAGVPDIRVRSNIGARIHNQFMTSIFSGVTGELIVSIHGPDIESMWRTIEGDLDDDGDVDVADYTRMIEQLGREMEHHRIWADLDRSSVVESEDMILQLQSFGEHSGLESAQVAVARSGEPCACPAGAVHCCYYDEELEDYVCCSEAPPTIDECIKSEDEIELPPDLADCLTDQCYLAWMQLLQTIAQAGEGCTWPPTVHYVDCSDCSEGRGGFADPGTGEIWICANEFTEMPEEKRCKEILSTLIEEKLHTVQLCLLGHETGDRDGDGVPDPQDPCVFNCTELFCMEAHASFLIECTEAADLEARYKCAYEKALETIDRVLIRLPPGHPCLSEVQACSDRYYLYKGLIENGGPAIYESFEAFIEGHCKALGYGDADGDGTEEGLGEFPTCSLSTGGGGGDDDPIIEGRIR